MTKPTVDLNAELHIIIANLNIITGIWDELFGKYAIKYDEAKKIVEDQLADAGSGIKQTMMEAVVGFAVDKFKGALGIYGDIGEVAITGLKELGLFKSKTGDPKKLDVPSSIAYAEQLRLTPKKMFEPFKMLHLQVAEQAAKKARMDVDEYARIKSKLLSSPIWFPPYKRLAENWPMRNQIEIALWCGFFVQLANAGHASHKLRFLDDVIKHLTDEGLVGMSDSKGWDKYPEPVSQGGPGDWTMFLYQTRRYWSFRADDVISRGWLAPLPDIPEDAKVQKSISWTPQKTHTYPAPTKSGKASITIQSVEMTVNPRLDWKDVPALVDFKKRNG